jgi:hypothetical protein
MKKAGIREQMAFAAGTEPVEGRKQKIAFRSRFFPPFPLIYRFFRQTALVTIGKAFYNPSNTLLEAVVSFIRTPEAQPRQTATLPDGECMNIDLHFCSSQEH